LSCGVPYSIDFFLRAAWHRCGWLLVISLLARPLVAEDAADHFESKVRPVLIKNCYACHTKPRKGGLRLDSREAILKGGKSGPAIEVGNPKDSLLIQAVSRTHTRLKMPPQQRLAAHEVTALSQWIQQGAVWVQSPSEFFQREVQPLLKKNCISCHGASPKGGLRMDSREALLKGGKSGAAVIPGDPEKSLLIKAVRYQHEKLKMPPKKALSKSQVATLVRWVAEGVAWDIPEPTAVTAFEVDPELRNFWSFQPVVAPEVPRVTEPAWNRNPVDAFIFSRIKKEGLQPARPASKRVLLRRATYDLIGLPPSRQEMADFLADDSPRAFEKVVDRLLASRHYGERWGRHWLDVVRYADTAGDAADYPVPEAYKYRNYVIDAFNQDKPYDQFVKEQLAGDLLAAESDDQRWEQVIATGYIAITRRIGVGPLSLRHITIENTIDNLGRTFLGLTIGCARCHDHKFDPIPTTDYYGLYGIFDSTVYPHPGSEKQPRRRHFVYRLGQQQADEILKPFQAELDSWNAREREKFREFQSFQTMKVTTPGRTREIVWKELQELRAQRAEVLKKFPNMEIAYAVQEGEPHDVRVQAAGDPKAPGAEVPRGFLGILGGAKLSAEATSSGRQQLADWIVDSGNPLTARVAVNRIWQHHFGRGLVKTASDFGVRGTPPTHPQLLDYLANYFVKEGWSIKKMHRLMMLSRSYQLASSNIKQNAAVDPDNDYLWRANRRRLDAEQIRDSILTFSGTLDRTPGERHPFPHRRSYFYRQHEPFAAHYPTRRRSVYLMQQRIQKNPYLDLFDGPDGNVPFATRRATTTTLQALYLMNSAFIHEQSGLISQHLIGDSTDTKQGVQLAYQVIFGRPAEPAEVDRAMAFLVQSISQLPAGDGGDKNRQQQAWSGYVRGMISSNEFMFID
jgi:hypothetical protein